MIESMFVLFVNPFLLSYSNWLMGFNHLCQSHFSIVFQSSGRFNFRKLVIHLTMISIHWEVWKIIKCCCLRWYHLLIATWLAHSMYLFLFYTISFIHVWLAFIRNYLLWSKKKYEHKILILNLVKWQEVFLFIETSKFQINSSNS